jgi:hypothetical protein
MPITSIAPFIFFACAIDLHLHPERSKEYKWRWAQIVLFVVAYLVLHKFGWVS